MHPVRDIVEHIEADEGRPGSVRLITVGSPHWSEVLGLGFIGSWVVVSVCWGSYSIVHWAWHHAPLWFR